MKTITRTIVRAAAFMLIAAMLLTAFAGCKKEPAKKTDAELLIGKWEANIDVSKAMEKEIAEDDTGLFGDLDLSGLSLKLFFSFAEDGSYELVTDEESAKNMMKTIGEQMVPIFKEFMMSLGGEEAGEVSDEELLEAMGISSWDELVDLMTEGMDSDEMELTEKGKYELKDGKLVMTEDGEDEAASFTYTISENELKFESAEGIEDENPLKAAMPITLTRVAEGN